MSWRSLKQRIKILEITLFPWKLEAILKVFLLVIFPLAIRNVNTVFSLIGVFKSKEALRKSLYPQVSRGRHGLLSPWRLSFWSGGPGCELVGIAWQEIGAISRPQFVVDNKRI